MTRKEKALDQARADLASLRRQHEQQTSAQASQLADARAEVAKLSRTHAELVAEVKKLAETTKQMEQRAICAEHNLKQRDEELDHERKQTGEAKRGRDESQAHIELLQRRLEAEQARRAAAEQMLEQAAQAAQPPSATATTALLVTTGASSVWLGLYQDFAAALGYDAASDPLFGLMHEEVRVAAAYADWQAKHMERGETIFCAIDGPHPAGARCALDLKAVGDDISRAKPYHGLLVRTEQGARTCPGEYNRLRT